MRKSIKYLLIFTFGAVFGFYAGWVNVTQANSGLIFNYEDFDGYPNANPGDVLNSYVEANLSGANWYFTTSVAWDSMMRFTDQNCFSGLCARGGTHNNKGYAHLDLGANQNILDLFMYFSTLGNTDTGSEAILSFNQSGFDTSTSKVYAKFTMNDEADNQMSIKISGDFVGASTTKNILHSARDRYFIRFNVDTFDQVACLKVWVTGASEPPNCTLEAELNGLSSIGRANINTNRFFTFDNHQVSNTHREQFVTLESPDYSLPDYDIGNHNTRFLDFDIINDNFYIQYYWDQSEIDVNLPERNPELFLITLVYPEDLPPEYTGGAQGRGFWIDPKPTETNTYDQNISVNFWDNPLPDGNYTAMIRFQSWGVGDPAEFYAFPEAYGYLDFAVENGIYTSIRKETTNPHEQKEKYNCSIYRLDHCIILSFRYLFIPADSFFVQFFELWEDIRTKPPAGYFTVLIDEITEALEVHENSENVINIDGSELQNTIFNPLKNTMTLILWGVGGFILFNRVKNIKL